jgi:hypothetical protein
MQIPQYSSPFYAGQKQFLLRWAPPNLMHAARDILYVKGEGIFDTMPEFPFNAPEAALRAAVF